MKRILVKIWQSRKHITYWLPILISVSPLLFHFSLPSKQHVHSTISAQILLPKQHWSDIYTSCSFISFLLDSNIFPSTLFPNTCNLCSSLKVKHLLHRYTQQPTQLLFYKSWFLLVFKNLVISEQKFLQFTLNFVTNPIYIWYDAFRYFSMICYDFSANFCDMPIHLLLTTDLMEPG
jgi:hypothetical protein